MKVETCRLKNICVIEKMIMYGLPAGYEIFLSSETSKSALRNNQLLFSGYGLSFLGAERPEREANYSPPSIAEVMNEWSCNSFPYIWPHSIYRESFTFVWSAAARLLRSWVLIPPGDMDVCLLWVLCVVRKRSSATSWSLVQRSSTDCGASLCVI
jgi:hypothetical protein